MILMYFYLSWRSEVKWKLSLRPCGILQAGILEWIAYPFSSESSWPRNWTQVSHIAGGFFTNWAVRKALLSWRQWDDIKGLFKMNLLLLNIIKEVHAQVMTMIHLFRWFFHTSLSSNFVTSLSILSANEVTFLFQKEIIRREFTSVSTGKATHLPASLHIVLPPFCPSACSVFLLFKVNPATCAADPVYPHLQGGTSQLIVFSLSCTICFRCSIGSSLTARRHADFILSKKQIATLFWPHISPSINPFIIPCIAKLFNFFFFLISTLTSLFLFNLPGLWQD